MSENDRSQMLHSWSQDYDRDVSTGDFPFIGYSQVLERVLLDSSLEAGMNLLELGPGTGNLTARLVDLGCRVLAVDFSAKMIEKARERALQARFLQADLLSDWPDKLTAGGFDHILSTYLLHEFQRPIKIRLLTRLAETLSPGGRIVIGDIAFPDEAVRAAAMARYPDEWDEEEEFWAAEEDLAALTFVFQLVILKRSR